MVIVVHSKVKGKQKEQSTMTNFFFCALADCYIILVGARRWINCQNPSWRDIWRPYSILHRSVIVIDVEKPLFSFNIKRFVYSAIVVIMMYLGQALPGGCTMLCNSIRVISHLLYHLPRSTPNVFLRDWKSLHGF